MGPHASLDEKLTTVLLENPSESHSILAALPFNAYVTANYNNFVAAALRANGREPVEALSRDKSSREQSVGWQSDRPLVYHLFGRIDDLDSMVLTEDDYFEFLIEFGRDRANMSNGLQSKLTSSSILFLGFNLNDWDFRVIFRSLTKLEGWANAETRTHFAVQVDPDDDFISDADRARDYLAKYFKKAPSVSIYWGSSEDFLRELNDHWKSASP